MIDVNTAYGLIKQSMPAFNANKIIEYSSCYVFYMNNTLNNGVMVNKDTGNVEPFLPFKIPIDEFRKGVEIKMEK